MRCGLIFHETAIHQITLEIKLLQVILIIQKNSLHSNASFCVCLGVFHFILPVFCSQMVISLNGGRSWSVQREPMTSYKEIEILVTCCVLILPLAFHHGKIWA